MEDLYKIHKERFGIEPNIIGMFWYDIELEEENIKKAIKENIPYDEYEMLSKEEKKAFNDGKLLF